MLWTSQLTKPCTLTSGDEVKPFKEVEAGHSSMQHASDVSRTFSNDSPSQMHWTLWSKYCLHQRHVVSLLRCCQYKPCSCITDITNLWIHVSLTSSFFFLWCIKVIVWTFIYFKLKYMLALSLDLALHVEKVSWWLFRQDSSTLNIRRRIKVYWLFLLPFRKAFILIIQRTTLMDSQQREKRVVLRASAAVVPQQNKPRPASLP